MKEVVGISFKNNGQVYYFNPNGLKLKKDDKVIVNTERGLQYGIVAVGNTELKKSELPIKLNDVLRICSKKDIANNINNIKLAKNALEKCKKMVQNMNLNMVILDANYSFDRSQLLFTFLSDNRVDFRKLAKELASIYKTRIELRQVGVRDKAKEIGGYGYCGRELCCAKFLNDFDSVSINMAKNQNFALNPSKINGICGRLLCCLKYEDECYKECNKLMPKVGEKVVTEFGEGKVLSVEPLKMSYKVELKDKEIIEVKINEDN